MDAAGASLGVGIDICIACIIGGDDGHQRERRVSNQLRRHRFGLGHGVGVLDEKCPPFKPLEYGLGAVPPAYPVFVLPLTTFPRESPGDGELDFVLAAWCPLSGSGQFRVVNAQSPQRPGVSTLAKFKVIGRMTLTGSP